jgi:NADH:ubiquinone oxidoreductase subunit 2 (subunit N)
MMYLTAIISIALTCALLIIELFTRNTNHIIRHAILGCIISTLFLVFCNYGLEMINWIALSFIPISFFILWIVTPPTNRSYEEADNECQNCQKPKKSCGCS